MTTSTTGSTPPTEACGAHAAATPDQPERGDRPEWHPAPRGGPRAGVVDRQLDRPTGAELTRQIGLTSMFDDLGLARRGTQAECPSPHHAQSGKTPPVSISEDKGVWNCHGCDAAGTGVDLLVLASGLDVASALDEMRRRAGAEAHGVSRPTPRLAPRRPSVPVSEALAAQLLARYLEDRRWRPEIAELFDLSVVVDAFGHPRIRHPYRSRGEVLWWQDRACNQGAAIKWLGPRGKPRYPYALDLVGGLDHALTTGGAHPKAVVVEGPADVIAMWHAFGSDLFVVGLPGTSGTEHWAGLFESMEVLVALDADPAGDEAAVKFIDAVTAASGYAYRVRPPDGVDVCEWRRELGDERFRQAFLACAEAAQGDLSVGADR